MALTSAADGSGDYPHGGGGEIPGRTPSDWSFHHQREIRDRVMPVRPFALGEFPFREAYWIAKVRIVADDEPEERFTLTRRPEGGLVLLRDRPSNGSVAESVDRLLMAGVDRSVDSVISKLELEHRSVDDGTCPILQSIGRELERMKLSTMPEVGIVIHGTRYEFVVQHQSGYFVQGEAYGQGGDRREREPFAKWAQRLSRVFKTECTGTVVSTGAQ